MESDVPYRRIRIWGLGTAVRSGGSEGPGTTRPPDLTLFNWRASSGPPLQPPEIHKTRGNVFLAVSCAPIETEIPGDYDSLVLIVIINACAQGWNVDGIP